MQSKIDILKGLVKPDYSHGKEAQRINTLKYGELFSGLRPSFAPTLNASALSSIQLGIFSLLGGFDKDIYSKYKLKGNALKVLLFVYCAQSEDSWASRKTLFKFTSGLRIMGGKSFELAEYVLVDLGFFDKRVNSGRGKAIFYRLTPKGIQVAEYYQNRINVIIHNLSYMMQNDEEIRKLF